MTSRLRRASSRRAVAVLKAAGLGLAVVAGVAALLGHRQHSADQRQARDVWEALEASAEPSPPLYDTETVADLPEIARRYFARAIKPGTPLHRVVRLEMEGTFVLNGTDMPMRARQIPRATRHGASSGRRRSAPD
jgi:hypothetical protein